MSKVVKSKITKITPAIRKEIASLDKSGSDSLAFLKKAGLQIVQLRTKRKLTLEQIASLSKRFNVKLLRRVERVGRGELLPELLLSMDAGMRKLMDLPIKLQKKYTQPGAKVPVVYEYEGKYKSTLIAPKDLSNKQVRQVFSVDKLRGVAAQTTNLKELKAASTASTGEAYTCSAGKFRHAHAASIPVRELLLFLAKHSTAADIKAFNNATIRSRKKAAKSA